MESPEPYRDPPAGADLQAIVEARHAAPADVLGPHAAGETLRVRAHIPRARALRIGVDGPEMTRVGDTALFEWSGPAGSIPTHYRLVWRDDDDEEHSAVDPYSFAPQLSDYDLHLFNEGRHWHIHRVLGAHVCELDGIEGVRFATWAPNAQRVSVVGDFNRWDGRRHPMNARGASGVWELFIPEVGAGALYKLELRNAQDASLHLKSDPYARRCELRPQTASIVTAPGAFAWRDQAWMTARANADWQHRAMSVYEVHLGSWQRDAWGGFLNYRVLAERLVTHARSLGFTHIELLPVGEHPLDASWGYQTIGAYAPTSRFGTPEDFCYLVDYCHRHGIGVLLDWVPAHFPKDSHGLARFDGSALYEHADPRRGEHRDWGTLIYNYARNEVRNFLLSNALYWLEEFHIDGLRVDAVASMLYLDYSREPDDWTPNRFGGNENLEAIEFVRELNALTHGQCPGTLMIAEESTAWPQVTRPIELGGLGFSMKWSLGWMHDTLDYIRHDPVHRPYHHDNLTFGLMYAFDENFVLPLSHDEVVHLKSAMIAKMPGDEWQRFANLRLLYTYMFTYPGKKLLFMGDEIAQPNEWDFDAALDWEVLQHPLNAGVQALLGALNREYRAAPALHRHDFEPQGFAWIDCHDASQCVLSYLRQGGEERRVVVLNFTPIPREDYRIGVPEGGDYEETINSDSAYYGGSNVGNLGRVRAQATPWMGYPHCLSLTLPPLGALVLRPTGEEAL